mgnify:CR=1 FL=1
MLREALGGAVKATGKELGLLVNKRVVFDEPPNVSSTAPQQW